MQLLSTIFGAAARGGAGACAMLALAGCGNLSGLDGSSEFSCKAPKGVHCESVSGNYHNRSGQATGAVPPAGAAAALSGGDAVKLSGATPRGMEPAVLRSPTRIMRLWVKAWEDSDRDLMDQSYVYVRIDDGNWRMAHVRKAAREALPSPRPPSPALSDKAAGRAPVANGSDSTQPPPATAEQPVLPGFNPPAVTR